MPEVRGRQDPGLLIPASAGVGLRFTHHAAVLEERPAAAWFEVHAENYMGGGRPLEYLEAIRCDYPIALHGVALSLGSAEGIDARHLQRFAALADRIDAGLVSEHLAWSASGGNHFPDLLPLPYTEEALAVVCSNVERAQQVLRRQVLVENPSSYLRYRHSTIGEAEFLAALAARTGCGILCDVNNVYVSACNLGFDAVAYLRALPASAVGEIHLAGHRLRQFGDGRSIRIDDHGSRVAPAVWSLYAEAIRFFGPRPTLIEWDTDVPALEVLQEEARYAERLLAKETADACAI
ncbi:MAG TPA: DUF692 domain-containing protein [Burkholderiales bacterium]